MLSARQKTNEKQQQNYNFFYLFVPCEFVLTSNGHRSQMDFIKLNEAIHHIIRGPEHFCLMNEISVFDFSKEKLN